MGYIFYVMGKSSSGKDTLFKKVREKMPELQTMIGYTTRPKRSNEVDGREYHFVSEGEMNQMEKNNQIIEKRSYQTVHGVWNYFTAADENVKDSIVHFIMIGTLESYIGMRNYYGVEKVIPIYIEVEDGVRLKRALEREIQQENPKYAEMCRRFLADEEDFNEKKIVECGIEKRFINDDLSECLAEICHYIEEECHGYK